MAKRTCANGHVIKDDKALKCSQCGADLPPVPKRSRLPLVLGILGVLFICGVLAVAIGGNGDRTTTSQQAAPAATSVPAASSPKADTPVAQPTKAAIAAAPTAKPIVTLPAYKKGESVTVDSQKVTLNNVTNKGNVVIADVTVENVGSKEVNISSMLSFQARDALGNLGDFQLAETKMDGMIQPNDKLRGTLGYGFAAGAQGLKLYYSSALFTGQPVVFALDDLAAKDPFPSNPIAAQAKPSAAGTAYKVGDAVKLGDMVLKLDKVTKQGTVVTAELTGYNMGGKAASLSSMLSFSGKDSTGKQGDFKLPSGHGFDGTLLPGDSLRGQVSFEFDAGATGLTMTYQSSLFGGQVAKWSLD